MENIKWMVQRRQEWPFGIVLEDGGKRLLTCNPYQFFTGDNQADVDARPENAEWLRMFALIRSAPDLYRALSAMEAEFGEDCPDEECGEDCPHRITRAALAKARGEL